MQQATRNVTVIDRHNTEVPKNTNPLPTSEKNKSWIFFWLWGFSVR